MVDWISNPGSLGSRLYYTLYQGLLDSWPLIAFGMEMSNRYRNFFSCLTFSIAGQGLSNGSKWVILILFEIATCRYSDVTVFLRNLPLVQLLEFNESKTVSSADETASSGDETSSKKLD